MQSHNGNTDTDRSRAATDAGLARLFLHPRGTVSTTLNFYAPPKDGSKPFNYVEKPPEGQPQCNFGTVEIPVTIHDIRGQESNFEIDTNAFATVTTGPSAEKDFTDDASMRRTTTPRWRNFF